MKIKKIEFIIDEENYKDELLIDGDNYGCGITKLEIIDSNDIRVYTYKNEKNADYGNEIPENMHRVQELSKYENIKIIEE